MTDQVDDGVAVVANAERPPVTVEALEAALKGSVTDVPADKPEAPVEAEAPAGDEQAKAEGETAEMPEGDPEPEAETDVKPKKGFFAKRIDALTWEKNEAFRKLAALEAEVATLKAAPAPKAETSKGPDPADTTKYPLGEFDAQYLKDLARHEAAAFVQSERERMESETRQREAAKARADFEAKLTEKDEGAYRLLNDPEMPATETMAEVILASDHGVKVADYLGRNPAECAKLAKLSPARQAYELGRLEVRLTAPPPVSKAPAPVPQVGARAQIAKRPEDMNQREFNEWWDANEAKRKRA